MGVKSRRSSRVLCLATAVLLFAGFFTRITLLSQMSEKSKQVSALEREIALLRRETGSLELQINEYHNLERIAAAARQMGMEQPDDTQIRVLHVNHMNMQDTSTLTAGAPAERK